MSRRPRTLILILAALLTLAACQSSAGGEPSSTASAEASEPASQAAQEPFELTLAHSYQEGQPQVECGVNIIVEEVEAADVGITFEVFGASELGGDADRIQSVIAGDIDMDVQGASGLSSVYAPIGAVDGAFVFDDSAHMYRFFSGEASDPLKQAFEEETGVHILGGWNTGARMFTANVPIRHPDDLAGLRMRFPPSPQYLMNAAAMGAEPVEVAFEELYLALQQGTVDGQENPVTNIAANNLFEVQDVISLSSHQLSSNLVVIGEVWNEFSPEQQAAVEAAVEEAMVEEPVCAAETEDEILADWEANNVIEIVDDVDRDAFREKAEPYLRENFTPEQVEVLDAVRSVAE